MRNIQRCFFTMLLLIAAISCNQPKPISKDITKTTVTVNGKKDSVINNAEKNYGNATVSEPCVKCLIKIIQSTGNYKTIISSIPPHNITYAVNWITSSHPVKITEANKIINGMQIVLNNKTSGRPKRIITYMYNNENQNFLSLDEANRLSPIKIDSASLKKIRNGCFWGVASSR